MAERYIPFPAFADWQGQASGMYAFDKVAAQFKELSARQREIFQELLDVPRLIPTLSRVCLPRIANSAI